MALYWYFGISNQGRIFPLLLQCVSPSANMALLRYIASIGAIVTVLAMTIDPSVQQMITIRSAQLNLSTAASLGRAQSFLQYDVETGLPTPEMTGAIYSGLFSGVPNSNAAAASLDMNPACPTGNCTFPPFQSLAVCSVCKNVASDLSRKCRAEDITPGTSSGYGAGDIGKVYCEFSLPNGLNIGINFGKNAYSGIVATNGTSQTIHNGTSRGNIFFLFSIVKELYNEDYAIPSHYANATQCLLYWCINTYEARVINGHFSEDIKVADNSQATEWRKDLQDFFRGSIASQDHNAGHVDLTPPRLVNRDSSRANSNYPVASPASLGVSRFLPSKLTVSNSFISNVTHGAKSNSSSNTAIPEDLLRVLRDSDTNTLFSNLAKSMTRQIRNVNAAYQVGFPGVDVNPIGGVGPANGTASTMQVFVSVRWRWLALPASLVLLTTTFLILTIINTARHRVPVWKSSPIPLLFSELNNQDKERLRMASGVVEMESLTAGIDVELKDDSEMGSGLRLAA